MLDLNELLRAAAADMTAPFRWSHHQLHSFSADTVDIVAAALRVSPRSAMAYQKACAALGMRRTQIKDDVIRSRELQRRSAAAAAEAAAPTDIATGRD
jgi:hypothetical protein